MLPIDKVLLPDLGMKAKDYLIQGAVSIIMCSKKVDDAPLRPAKTFAHSDGLSFSLLVDFAPGTILVIPIGSLSA